MITPTTSATMPAAWTASMTGDISMVSPKTTTPSRIPASGSEAVIAGSEEFSGAALNAFCISQLAIRAAATRQYGAQLVSSPANECASRICTVRRVSASEMPKTSPAPTPVSVARVGPERRCPA